jgi:CBS domain-containing protein
MKKRARSKLKPFDRVASGTNHMVRKVLPEIVSNQNVFELAANATVHEAVRGMAEKNVHSVLVTDGGKLTGIFTSTDLVLKVVAVGLEPNMTALGEVMTRDPETVNPGFNAIEALHRMHDGRFRHMPVVENGKVVGILSRRDFLDYEIEELEHQEQLWEKI